MVYDSFHLPTWLILHQIMIQSTFMKIYVDHRVLLKKKRAGNFRRLTKYVSYLCLTGTQCRFDRICIKTLRLN